MSQGLFLRSIYSDILIIPGDFPANGLEFFDSFPCKQSSQSGPESCPVQFIPGRSPCYSGEHDEEAYTVRTPTGWPMPALRQLYRMPWIFAPLIRFCHHTLVHLGSSVEAYSVQHVPASFSTAAITVYAIWKPCHES